MIDQPVHFVSAGEIHHIHQNEEVVAANGIANNGFASPEAKRNVLTGIR
jgi:hypothetical protein